MTGYDNHDGDHPKTSNTSPLEDRALHEPYRLSDRQVIQNGNGPVFVTTDTNGMIKVLPSKTAEEVVARENERKARTTLLMALPEDHLAKFHKMADAKEIWEAIKSRFGGNDESKKMQKYLLKQQFKGFSVSTSEDLHKGYDRFQTLLSQLEIHGTTASSSNTQNVAFVSADNTSSTNDVSTDYSVSSPSISKSQKEGSSSYNDEVIHSFFANQSRNFARDCRAKGNQDSRRRDAGYNGNKTRDNGRRPAYQDDSKALVIIDGEDIDWFGHVEEDAQNYVMMAYSSSNSGINNEFSLYDREKSSFAFTDSVKHVKTSRENVKERGTPNHSHKIEKHDRNGFIRKGLGYAFTRKACFVCGSFSHLIRDCNFHEKRMAKQAELTNSKNKVSGQRENRPVWNNVQRVNHQYKFVPSVLLTKTGKFPGNKAHLADYQEFKSGSIAFGGRNGRITGIKREYSNARTPQQNRVVERKNRTLIEAARTMLADSFLPTTFWAEAVNTACYVLNRVLVTKPQNKTPYELLTGKQPIISYLRPFGCHVTILNTIDQLGKFDEKSDSGFLVGYSLNSKAFRVYNLETKRVEENLHVNFLENKPNVVRKGHAWMFDLDYLTNSMNYEPVSIENQANKSACPKEANNSVGTQANDAKSTNSEEINLHEEHFVLPIWSAYSTIVKSSGDKIGKNTDFNTCESLRKEATHDIQNANTSSTNLLNTISIPLSTTGPSRALNDGELSYPNDPLMPHLKDIYASPSKGIFTDSSYDDEGVVTDFNNLETTVNVSPTPTTRIHTIHPKTQILGDLMSAVQTRSKVNKHFKAHALLSYIQKQQRNNHKDFQHCLFACFLSQIEPKKISQALEDERIDYDEVFAHVARIEAIRIFLAFASYMGFIVYQMDVKRAFLYCTIDEEVYVSQPPGFVDLKFPNKVYKIVKALYGLHQAPRACVKTASTPIETQKPLVKDEEAADVDVHLYRFMIGSLMYLTASTPDIMFAVYACSSDYAGTNLDKKSTTGGCQFLGKRLILWQCKKQTIVATSTKEAEYVAAAHCCGQVLWIQNQLLNYGFNFMSIKIYIDNESTICIVKNPVFHSKTKHIEIRHHFIRDAYEKKLIQVLKIHTDDNAAALLTKAFNVSRTAKVKTINDEVRIQALIDEKRVNIKESSICHTLKIDDAEGTSCLSNAEIFNGLAKMGYEKLSEKLTFYKDFFSPQWKFLIHTILQCLSAKTTSGNEFSSTMASAIICEVQLLKLEDMSHHKDIYANPSFTKKVFANMKRVGAGFSRVVTALFDTMLVPAAEEVSLIQANVQSTTIPTEPSTSKPYKKHKSKKQKPQAPKDPSPEPSPEHMLPSPSNDLLPDGQDSMKLKDLIDLCTHLSNKVLELESEVIDIKSSYKERIEKLEGRVTKLEEENGGRIIAEIDEDVEINLEEAQAKLYKIDLKHPEKVLITTAGATTTAKAPKVSVPRRRRGVIIHDPEETTSTVVMHSKVQSKDKGKVVINNSHLFPIIASTSCWSVGPTCTRSKRNLPPLYWFTLPSLMVACCLRVDEFLDWLLVVGKRDVTTADRNDSIWLMASMGSSPYLNTRTVRPESSWGNSEVLMIGKVIHTVKTDIVKLMVEIESFGMSSDEFDNETGSSDGLQPKQADLSCVHALNELYMHEIHFVPSKHEAHQY
uniref:Ribonuclease H-like domain-containing protein n=1 Tax=Tanacetum cinerariifolium TaxID=118510 RepID=A0A6L2M3G6_TANCI|nr:ribonuclease H-like domain-containing protein [Tanacetum cinerariifolium]